MLKDDILKLREQKKSYLEISKILNCAKSTVSFHCKNNNVNDIGLGKVPIEVRVCLTCKSEFKIKKDQPKQRYCKRKCADESKSKKELGRINGIKSAQVKKIRSKNEIYFFDLCKAYFNLVSNNEVMFNGWDADVIIHDFKIAILWNGKWHYEKITKKHSLKQVQNRDRIKIQEIIKSGFIPYIIKDMGKENKIFVEERFHELCRYIPSLS